MILSPPTERFMERPQFFDHLGLRYQRLIEVLEGRSSDPEDVHLLSPKCLVALSPFRGNNILIVGERLLYEGIKANISGGFEFTTRVTHPSLVEAQIRAFDTLFEDAARYTSEYFGNAVPVEQNCDKRVASVVTGLLRSYKRYRKSRVSMPREKNGIGLNKPSERGGD